MLQMSPAIQVVLSYVLVLVVVLNPVVSVVVLSPVVVVVILSPGVLVVVGVISSSVMLVVVGVISSPLVVVGMILNPMVSVVVGMVLSLVVAHVGHVHSHLNGFRKSAILLLTNSLFLSYAYQKWQAATFRLYEHIQATHLTIFQPNFPSIVRICAAFPSSCI